MDDEASNIPDGGWGWVIVAGVALINMTNQSILSVFGLLFGDQLTKMQKDTFTASLITNANSLALNFSGLFIGPAIKSFRPRNVAVIGCLMVSAGLFVCAFATESWHFIGGYSLMVGMGLGLISPSTFMAINSYFTTKRGRAVGCSLAGTGLGQVFIPHLVRVFLEIYGFRGAVLAMAILSLTGLFGAALLRPLESRKPAKAKHIAHNSNEQEMENLQPPRQPLSENNNKNTKSKYTHSACGNLLQRLAQAMDLELLKDPIFLSIIIGMALVYTSTVNFSMLFPNFLKYSVQLTSSQTATCMSVMAGADIVFRLLLPCITDKLNIPYRVVFLLGTAGLMMSRAVLAESLSLSNIILMSIFTGMTKSATVINNNLTVSGYCRPDKLAGGLGLNMISKGVIVITVGQLLGWIRDYSDSYVMGLHAQNMLLLLVVLVWTPEILCQYWRQRSKRNVHKIDADTHGIEETVPMKVAEV